MKITIQDCPSEEEEEIVIRCRQVDEHLLKLIYSLKAGREKLTVSKGERIFQVQLSEIYYFEAVDNKVFACMEKEVFDTKSKLYELEERLKNTDFFRASKSTIINLARVKNICPAFNGRFEVCMENGERLIVSRQYVPFLKNKLGL
ncbi:MAG: LytTR family transcriptional regulator DNA-binding domain-containing protein [Butyrivibrio sp.]|nr:LytTR family transcriptional regulator DNA-binding domain-containing protein [Acetatifactor muris]MCM1558490.1 LytTR family transcriptional regulator DNA-binding domain-containing protein [Butyrivibrio sp.]